MAKLKYQNALEQVQQGKVEKVYLLIGEDYYQKFLLTEKIIEKRLAKQERTYNKFSVSANKATPSTLEEMLYGVPLLGGNTVAIVSDLERLPQASQQFLPKALKALDSSVTFVGTAKKLDGRTAFAKAMSESCAVVEIKELYADALPGYVRSRFAERGMLPDDGAVREFCRVIGSDCGDIENEVEKISIANAGKKKLTEDDVKEYLSESRFFSQFEIAESIGRKDLVQSLAATRQYLESSGSDSRGSLFWALYGQLERLLACKALSGKLTPADLAGKLRMHPFFLNELRSQAEKQTFDSLISSLASVYQAEVDDRFSTEPKEQIFERMIIKMLCPTGE